jgi:peptide deformylase
MILPIVAYGDPVLKRKADDIAPDYPQLDTLIANMWETMYNAHGVGLAAPQVGLSIRLFVVDTAGFAEEGEDDYELLKNFKKVFINPTLLQVDGEPWKFNEGCLSIPDIHEDIARPETVVIRYQDEAFQWHEETHDDLIARVIQHEYDHIEGILFTDRMTAFKRKLLQGRLSNISKGKIEVGYKMKFPLR